MNKELVKFLNDAFMVLKEGILKIMGNSIDKLMIDDIEGMIKKYHAIIYRRMECIRVLSRKYVKKEGYYKKDIEYQISEIDGELFHIEVEISRIMMTDALNNSYDAQKHKNAEMLVDEFKIKCVKRIEKYTEIMKDLDYII